MFKEITQNEYHETIQDKDKDLYILVFHALWCPPCRMFKNSLEEISNKDKVKVYRVDIDQNKELAGEFQVMSIPTWFIFKNNEIVYKGNGYVPYEELKQIVSQVK
ncbi:thioredoxin family protein [Mycoplasmopsis adleri]|uniref:thioredoxin family protein n=1 Tax=Mycoplasmopsis adleri TaxID=51362 RepID=UPI00387313DB